ncbi:hypothetical protein YQE_06564, partial [Dendroctonus ponderosae]
MWSTAVVLVVLIVLAFSQALPKELYQYKIKNVEPMKSPSYRLNTLHNYKGNLARSLDTIGGGGILSSRALHYYGRNPLASRRRLDSIGGGGILSARGLDSIGGGGLLRSIDDIGGGGILSARSMDGIGGGGILEARSMDGIGGGGILGARSMDGIGGGGILGARSMDGIGGGGILGARSMDGIGGGGILESRSMDDIGGGGILRSIDDIGDGGILEARDMDDIGGGGILDSRGLFDGGFFGYRNVDNIGGGGGRFGRSCPPMAEGCVGKRAKPWEFAQLSSDDEMSPDAAKDFNINEISRAFRIQSDGSREENGNHKISPFQRIFRYNPIEDKFQRMTDPDYSNFFLQ